MLSHPQANSPKTVSSHPLVWPLCALALGLVATLLAVRHVDSAGRKHDALRFEQHAEHAFGDFLERIRRLSSLSESLDQFWLQGPAAEIGEWRRIVATLGASGNYAGLESAAVMVPGPRGPAVRAWASVKPSALPAPDEARLEGWRKAARQVAESDAPIALDAALDRVAADAGRVVIISPVCAKSGGKHTNLVAWSALTLGLADLLDGLVPPLPGETQPRLRIEAFEIMPDGGQRFVYSNEPLVTGGAPRFSEVRSYDSAGRRWRMHISSTPAFDAHSHAAERGYALFAGLLLSALATAIVYSLTHARAKAVEIARQMTASFEQSAAEAKNLLAIANRSDTGLIILDRHLRLVWVNRIVCGRTGYMLDELRGNHFGFLVSEALPDSAIEPGKAIVIEADLRGRLGDRTRVEFDLQPVFHSGPGPEYYLGTARLVNDRDEYRRGLRRAYKALEAVGDRIAMWDPAGRLIYINPSFEAGFGYSLAECAALGGPFSFAEDASQRERLSKWPEAQENDSAEIRMKSRDGSVRDMRVRMDRIADDLGHTLGSVAVFVDISEHKQLQVELSQARDSALEHARMKSAFLANMSHEIRTPLNGVTGMMNLLLTTSLDPEQREYAELANVSANSLLAVVNDILDFSKIEAGKMSIERVELDLRELFADVNALMSLAARTKGLTMESSIDDNVPAKFVGDPTRLRQVLLNLLGNAVKFTARGRVGLNASATAGALRIEVTDTGIGIPAGVQAKLFQPFVQADRSTTRKYGGTGLGLAISRQIVELSSGQIGCISAPGRGSVFWVELPLGPGSAGGEPVPIEHAAAG